jgi:hypothetical protein
VAAHWIRAQRSVQKAGDGCSFRPEFAAHLTWSGGSKGGMRGSRARACGVPRLSQAQRSCLGELAQGPNGRLARRKAHLNILNLCLTAAARARPYFETASVFPLGSGPLAPSHPTPSRPPGHNSASSPGLSPFHALLLSESTAVGAAHHTTPHHTTPFCRL